MNRTIPILLISLFTAGCSNEGKQEGPNKAPTASGIKAAPPAVYTTEVVPSEKGGYGYIIYKNEKALIRQLHIPGMKGKTGFSSRSEAEKVAGLVENKLRSGSFPPTVSTRELDSLQIHY